MPTACSYVPNKLICQSLPFNTELRLALSASHFEGDGGINNKPALSVVSMQINNIVATAYFSSLIAHFCKGVLLAVLDSSAGFAEEFVTHFFQWAAGIAGLVLDSMSKDDGLDLDREERLVQQFLVPQLTKNQVFIVSWSCTVNPKVLGWLDRKNKEPWR